MKRTNLWIGALALLAIIASASWATAHVLSGDAEVRVAARRLADGKTEFALQQRVDGQWSERMLPSARKLPAEPAVGKWLHSSALTLETTTQAETSALIVRKIGQDYYDSGRIATNIKRWSYGNEGAYLESSVSIRADGEHALGVTPLELRIECNGSTGGLEIGIVGNKNEQLPPRIEDGSGSYFVSYQYQFPADTGNRGLTTIKDARWMLIQWRDQESTEKVELRTMVTLIFYENLKEAESLEITVTGAGNKTKTSTFSLDGAFETPIQPNLDRCGQYH